MTSFGFASPQNIHTVMSVDNPMTDLDLIKTADGMVCYVGVSFKFEENWNDSKHGFAILKVKVKYYFKWLFLGTLTCVLSQM